jgi:hypothetical protein
MATNAEYIRIWNALTQNSLKKPTELWQAGNLTGILSGEQMGRESLSR